MTPQAFFLPAEPPRSGQRFCLFHPACGRAVNGLVLYIHPFAEEMNKARRMAALQARALAQAGFSVLQIDLLGCGDSSGDFGDATWQDWVGDVVQACRWLRDRAHGADPCHPPLWLWGLRAGCLLAAHASERLAEPCDFLFWQPPAAGKPLLTQFLRLKLAGELLSRQATDALENMRRQLANGSPVEVAGYMLSPGLAVGLEQAALSPPDGKGRAGRLLWFELSTREDASLSPISVGAISRWRQSGFDAASHVVRAAAFWQTSEIEEAPALMAATTAALAAMSP